MNLSKKFSTFIEVAKVLNKHGIIPVLFGSLGLHRIINQDEVNDIDIIIPNKNLINQFDLLKKAMTEIGYEQDKTYPHEFTKGDMRIGFEPESDLEELAIDPAKLKIAQIDNSQFKELTAEDYLKIYKRNLATHEPKIISIKRKIEVLKKLLGNKKENNFAFIDSQNINLSIRELGWKLDFYRFRKYLFDKYNVSKAFLFIGFVEGNNELYKSLQETGFICIFKPTLKYKDGHTKGNCDAELVLQAMVEYPNYDKAVIVTGDGDFYCLAKYLIEKEKLEVILVPNRNKFSALLRFKVCRPFLRFMNDLRNKLEYKKKRPHKDGTL